MKYKSKAYIIFTTLFTITLLIGLGITPKEWQWLAQILVSGFLLLDVAIYEK